MNNKSWLEKKIHNICINKDMDLDQKLKILKVYKILLFFKRKDLC